MMDTPDYIDAPPRFVQIQLARRFNSSEPYVYALDAEGDVWVRTASYGTPVPGKSVRGWKKLSMIRFEKGFDDND